MTSACVLNDNVAALQNQLLIEKIENSKLAKEVDEANVALSDAEGILRELEEEKSHLEEEISNRKSLVTELNQEKALLFHDNETKAATLDEEILQKDKVKTYAMELNKEMADLQFQLMNIRDAKELLEDENEVLKSDLNPKVKEAKEELEKVEGKCKERIKALKEQNL